VICSDVIDSHQCLPVPGYSVIPGILMLIFIRTPPRRRA
jgi:hypothetical protein